MQETNQMLDVKLSLKKSWGNERPWERGLLMLFPKWRQNPTRPIFRYFSVVNLEKDNFTNFTYSWQINENSYMDNFFAVVIRKKGDLYQRKKKSGVTSTLKLKRIRRWIIDYDKPRLIQWTRNTSLLIAKENLFSLEFGDILFQRKGIFKGSWRK